MARDCRAAEVGVRDPVGMAPRCSQCKGRHLETSVCLRCFNCKEVGHLSQDCKDTRRQGGPYFRCFKCDGHHAETVECYKICYNCRRVGHLARDCRAAGRQTESPNPAPINVSYPQGQSQQDQQNGNLGGSTAGTFLPVDLYATIIFGVDYSLFLQISFFSRIIFCPTSLGVIFEIVL